MNGAAKGYIEYSHGSSQDFRAVDLSHVPTDRLRLILGGKALDSRSPNPRQNPDSFCGARSQSALHHDWASSARSLVRRSHATSSSCGLFGRTDGNHRANARPAV